MAVKRQYQIALDGLPVCDRILFKLIFSASTRLRGRHYTYHLLESDVDARPDFVIVPDVEAPQDHVAGVEVPSIRIVDAGCQHSAGLFLQRPLIATRVIGVLDECVVRQLATGSESAGAAATPVGARGETTADEPLFPEGLNTSELAIVHDDALNHPANAKAPRYDDAVPVAGAGQSEAGKVVFAPAGFTGSRPAHSAAPESQSEPAESSPAAGRALVVDDSGSVRKQLELELALFDVEAHYAVDAAGASELLAGNRYDVVFLDVVLPDGDGFEICKSLKDSSRDTTVIMLTSKATKADRLRGSLAGCDAYLVKPVGRATFQNTVRNHLALVDTAHAAQAC